MEKWLELKMMKADSEPYEKSNKRGRARRSIKGKNLSLWEPHMGKQGSIKIPMELNLKSF